ncbi:GNAT family N-acetyltransferase [bacterium]|nr:GNAT family N-acetyltransferase [bacterium]
MIIERQHFQGAADPQRMAGLVRSFPADNLHVADLPYRLCSWALDDHGNIGLWTGNNGDLVAWAVLQTPFVAIDIVVHPACADAFPHVLDWADARAKSLVGTPHGLSSWYVNVFAGQSDRIRHLEAAGFASQADVGEDSWSKVLLRRPATEPVDGGTLPEGYLIRPLAGDAEVEAYVEMHREVFQSRNMTVEWRRRVLRHPDYVPQLDLVAVSPSGQLAAFCICWLDTRSQRAPSGQVEPFGARSLGLGRAMLAEGMRRLQQFGAEHIYVETDNYRNAALKRYTADGFRTVGDVLVYRKDYGT